MLKPPTRIFVFHLALAAVCMPVAPLNAADSYAGKTIELVVGAAPGGGYDIYARAVGRHLGRHIPGEPTVVVKNMPGAGSAKAAQYIQGIAPKDGTAIAGVMPGAIMGPLLDDRTAPLFNPTKVRYIGTANSGVRVCVTLKGNKIGSFADAQKVQAKLGGSGPNDSTFEYGLLHRHTSGALWDVVTGYRGTNEMGLAMERGEVDGVRVHQGRGKPQGGRAGGQPDRVPPLLHRAARNAAGATRNPAQGVR